MRKKLIIFSVVALAASQALASASSSISVTSLPQGMVVIASAAVGSTTYLSLPLSGNVIYAGTVSAAGSNSINVATSRFTSILASANAPCFVKMLSGGERGRMMQITSNSANSLIVSTADNTTQQVTLLTSGFSVSAGDNFEIVPGDTIAAIFGANTRANPLTLAGSSNFNSADWVKVYNPSAGIWQAYYFNTSYGYWTLQGTTTNANNTVLYPYSGLSITRNANSEPAASLILTGRVAEVPVMTKTTGNNAVVYGSTGYPLGLTLSQLNFGANWLKGTSTTSADVLSVWNNSSKSFLSYYQMPDSTWRQAGNTTTDQSGTVVPAGDCISLQQHLSVSGSTSYLPSSMPYTVPTL
ncbi:MAG TPA: hypothetical protein VHY09_11940 [Candidatus Methylacidiphilales bacterium]|jgi:hypothetical protein|nr:hypothetical protein [Candidatus Methylacidiphilales bacterium]